MIWILKIECAWEEKRCIRLIEIDSTASLYDLHLAIQNSVNFGNDHLFEFYAGRNQRNRKKVFSENYENWEEMVGIFYQIKLDEVYPLEKGLQLYYLFDFGDTR